MIPSRLARHAAPIILVALALPTHAAARRPAGLCHGPAHLSPAPSGLPRTYVCIATAHGVRRFTVEIARSELEQAHGLMGRRSLAQGVGMLFPFAVPREATFWMHDTLIPLDIVFIRRNGTVANVAENAHPMDDHVLPSAGPVDRVLEIAGGEAERLGIRPGDRVDVAPQH